MSAHSAPYDAQPSARASLASGPWRYLAICLFIPSMLIPLAIVEWLFAVSGSGLSLADSRGAGQVTLLAMILLMVAAFSRFVAGERPLAFFEPYLRQWRRGLTGFALFYLATTVLVIVGYLGFAAMGAVGWSEAGIAALSWKIAERTAVALLVVVILALTEEVLFRVFLMRYLRWNTSPAVTIAAVVFAAAVFAAAHNLTDPLAWFTREEAPLFVGLFLLGVLLCVTYLSTGSFLCAVGVHVGLLGSKVFLRKTELVEVDPSAVFLSDSYDLRMSPVVWALFAGMAVAIFLLRHRLNRRFAIEKPVVGPA